MSPYARLAELARLQVELIGEGRLDEVGGAQAEWDRLVAQLPAAPPGEARAHLEAADAAIASFRATLEAGLAAAGQELVAVATGRRATVGYAGADRRPAFETRG